MTAADDLIDDLGAEMPEHEAGRPCPVPTEIVAEWDSGTFIETLAPRLDGSWLVTIPSHNRIDRVARDGTRTVFAELDRHPTGMVTDGEQTYVLAGSLGVSDWLLVRLDADGEQSRFALPELVFGNGLARAGDRLLAADSALGLVLAVDPAGGGREVWVRHALLEGPKLGFPMPGANGVGVHDGGVYVSNTGRGLLLRYALDDTAAEPSTVARRLVSDNFAIHPDGRIFLATHYLHSILQLNPDGSRLDIAGSDEGIAGSTSAVLDPQDPETLYVTTTGGMNGLEDRAAGPARLLRLDLRPQA